MSTIASLVPLAAEFKADSPESQLASDEAGRRPYLAFDAANIESAYWTFVAPVGLASPYSLVVTFTMIATTIGSVVWDASIEAVNDADNIGVESFATANIGAAATVPAAVGVLKQVTLSLTNDDSVLPGDVVRLRLRRLTTNSGDTAPGDAFFIAAEVRDAS